MRPHLDPKQVALKRATQIAVDGLFMMLNLINRLRHDLQGAIELIQKTCPHPTVIGGKGNRICQSCGKRISKKEMDERKKKGRKK